MLVEVRPDRRPFFTEQTEIMPVTEFSLDEHVTSDDSLVMQAELEYRGSS